MQWRSMRFRVAALAVIAVALVGAWGVSQGAGITVAAIGLAGLVGVGLVMAFVIRGPRGGWLSRVAAVVACVVAWGLAVLAFGIRSLCWGNPDRAERDACETQWLTGAAILVVIGVGCLVAGFWPSSRSGARRS